MCTPVRTHKTLVMSLMYAFTEDGDDKNVIDGLEDEEEQPIMDGGVGIPIRPVSDVLPSHIFLSHRATTGWCPTSPVTSPRPSTCW